MMRWKAWLERRDWSQAIPQDELRYNSMAVNHFVDQMANNDENAWVLFLMLSRNRGAWNPVRYNQKISENLLTFDNAKLKNAVGEVTPDVNKSIFRFIKGEIDIIHPPVIYDNTDKKLLFSVILHELRHAQDWINPNIKFNPVRYNEFNIEKYVSSLVECRAYSEQLRSLMLELGGVEQVLQAFSQESKPEDVPGYKGYGYVKHSPFSYPPQMLGFVKEFLSNFTGIKKELVNPPAQKIAVAKNVVDIVVKIMNLMYFRNFLIKV